MISIKTPREIELMRVAGEIVGDTHKYLIPYLKPGITTKKIDSLARDYILKRGATPSCYNYEGYPANICISINDEVVHGKATILNKMNGKYENKFPQARAMYLYMMVHPGKKLNFMGNEIGQFREWDEKREQDWSLRNYPAHDAFYTYIAELNQTYLTHSALWSDDYNRDGFAWLDCHQEERCVYIIERRSKEETLIAAFNFSRQEH